MFIDGYLALATAFPTPFTITEYSSATYRRQPVSFGRAMQGVTRNAAPVSFGFGIGGGIAGFGLFSSPSGSELLLAIPFFTPAGFGSSPAAYDVGAICLLFNDLVNEATGAASSYVYGPGAAIGSCWRDPQDFAGMSPALTPAGATIPGGPVRQFLMGTLSPGTPLTIKRGVLSASEMA